jgi:hypothetical protein
MPSVVSNGTHVLYSDIGYRRLAGVERVHSVLAVRSKVPDYGCPFGPEKATGWAIIRATHCDGAGPTPSSARRSVNPSKEGRCEERSRAGAGIELACNVYRSTAMSVVTGGAGSDGD